MKTAEMFAERLYRLRSAKGVSAREMSLSLGQGAGYINNIENGRNLPSMSMFFEICGYLQVTPGEFFDAPAISPNAERLLQAAGTLDRSTLQLLTELAEKLKGE